jgi:hypothetical protein
VDFVTNNNNHIGIGMQAGDTTNGFSIWDSSSGNVNRFFLDGVSGNIGIGTTAPNTALDINGAVSNRGIASPAVSPTGQGRIYFDSTANKYRVSENGGTYQDLVIGNNACPAGFTKVGNMGCIQNDEEGTGTWFAANDDCFSTYNGRLPTYSEWYLALNNNALSNETDDWEWIGETTSGTDALRAGSTGITIKGEIGTANSNAYRCWIPIPL